MPVYFELLSGVVAGIVDMVWVARLGKAAVGAVAVASTLENVFLGIILMANIGVTVLIADALGGRRRAELPVAIRAVGLAGLDAHPAYYAHMAPANSAGPAEIDLTPPRPVDPAELRRRIEAGEWVVDLRQRTAFAAGHLAGALNLGLDGSFVTYLGWLIPWGTPVSLLGETAEQVAEAQRDLVRIGIDRPAAAATGDPADWAGEAPLATTRTATFAELRSATRGDSAPYVLDVRRHDERRGSHVVGSRHIPLHELAGRLAEVPDDRPVWVHCAGGYRAAIAASILARAGFAVVLIDDDFDRAANVGVSVAATA